MFATNAPVHILIIRLVKHVEPSHKIIHKHPKAIYAMLVAPATRDLIARVVCPAIMVIQALKVDFVQYALVIHLEVFIIFVIILLGNVIAVMVLVVGIAHHADRDMLLLMDFVLHVIKVFFFKLFYIKLHLGCYQVLMNLEDQLEYAVKNVKNISEIKPIPRKRLNRISSTVSSLDDLLNHIKLSENDVEALLSGSKEGLNQNHFRKQASVVEQEFDLLKERNDASLARLESLGNQLDVIREQIHQQNQLIVGKKN